MNVNIWGPDFWNVLHGVAIVANENNSVYADEIYTHMKNLLPCIFCLKSYRIFHEQLFKEKSLKSYIDEGRGPEVSWEVHNLVNEKLLKQKVEIVGSSLDKKIREAFPLLTKTNFIKRANLSGDYAINDHAVWRMLFILTVALEIADEIEENNERSNATYNFIRSLSAFLKYTVYDDLGKSLSAILRSTEEITHPKQLFVVLAFYQDSKSAKPISLKYVEKLKKYSDLYEIYKDNLLAKKCAINTCQ